MRKNSNQMKKQIRQLVDVNSKLKKLESVFLDPNVINWMIRGGARGVRERLLKVDYSVLRNIVDKVPLLNAIIKCRINQVKTFSRYISEEKARDGEKGFRLIAVEEEGGDQKSPEALAVAKFIKQTGYSYSTSREDDFPDYLEMMVREVGTIDQIATEIQYNLKGEPAAFWLLDGSTIKRTTPDYPKKNVAFIQVVDDVIHEEYNHNNLVFDYKNKRADIRFRGYGYSDTEMAIDIITTLLFGYNHLRDQFIRDKVPRGFISVMGDIDQKGITAIQQYWYSAMSGAGGQWAIPILPSGKEGVGLDFKAIGQSNKDMEYHRLMMFISSLLAAVFSIDLAELGIRADDAQSQHLFAASDLGPRIQASMDRGLDSLLMFLSQHMNKVLRKVTPRWEFVFTGQNVEDELRKAQIMKARLEVDMTINDYLKKQGRPTLDREYADEVLNQGAIQLLLAEKNREAQEKAQKQQQEMMGGGFGGGEEFELPEIGGGEKIEGLEGEGGGEKGEGVSKSTDWPPWEMWKRKFAARTRELEVVG